MSGDNRPILLVEDDLAVRASLSDFLRDQGWKTCCASTLREGWELLQEHGPVVCLLDLNLPDGNGIELLKKIVQHGLDVQVIIMTAFGPQHLHPGAGVPALRAWMTKPVAPGELLDALRQAMNGSRSRA